MPKWDFPCSRTFREAEAEMNSEPITHVVIDLERQMEADWEAVKQGTMTYRDEPPREMRKEEAKEFERGTLSIREELLLVKGHMAYLENKIKNLSKKDKDTDVYY